MDVDSDTSLIEAIRAIEKSYGPLDVLVNTPGSSEKALPKNSTRRIPGRDGDKLFRSTALHQGCVTADRARRNAAFLNLTSVSGRISSSPLGAYAASKFALEGLSEALAQEAKMFNIRVAIVQPGIIDTAMTPRHRANRHVAVFPGSAHGRALHGLAPNADLTGRSRAKIREIIESGNWQWRHPVGLMPSLS